MRAFGGKAWRKDAPMRMNSVGKGGIFVHDLCQKGFTKPNICAIMSRKVRWIACKTKPCALRGTGRSMPRI